MAKIGKVLAAWIIGDLILSGVCFCADNIVNGRTLLGKKKKPKDKTHVDWRGNIILGKTDFQVT